MKNSLILIPFNAPLDNVCDYAEQTAGLLAKDNTVIGVALSSPLSLVRNFAAFWQGKYWLKHWGIPVFRPVMFVPLQRFELIKRLNMFINVIWLNILFSSDKRKKILWFFEPQYLSHFLRSWRYDISLYDCVDYFPAYKQWRAEHEFCLRHAGKIVVNSQSMKRLYLPVRKDITVVPLGFSQRDLQSVVLKTSRNKKSPLTFGYIGTVGDRLDFQFLSELFDHQPKDHFVFIGPQGFDPEIPGSVEKHRLFRKMLRRKNVQWLPPTTRRKLWQQARRFDVSLVPYDTTNDFNHYAFPMKIMEYWYAGLPVVSTNIKEFSRYPDLIYLPLKQGWQGLDRFIRQTSSVNWQRAARATALENTWEKKLAVIIKLLS